ncbi:hypothetical protein J2129_000886 [Methanofollis sp. W23]|uniref:hypothetical protein n=1 Tax=Methanofollis sp. W23 TaxID=2817849 RepID=UPI001AE4548D|nr:hypothetical protein [Methanofollis sp. W23]MBP2145432.1 hypothetical protein [Methanofollis sp. W23]
MTPLSHDDFPDPPVCLPAYRRPAKKTGQVVWCPHCGLFHLHGEGPGRLFFHRVAHCVHPVDGEDPSPYLASGYFVIPTGKTLPEKARIIGDRLHRKNLETPSPETPRPLPGEWARPLTYAEAVDSIVEWYQQAECPEVEIAGALEGFTWMYERITEKYRAEEGEQSAT